MLPLINIPSDNKFLMLAMIVFSFAMTLLMLKVLGGKLPRDGGRDFAFNGKLSQGKPRGAGIIFVSVFIVSSLIFTKISIEFLLYYLLVFLGMMSGYLDDRSEKPWSEYKKGAIDVVVSAGTAAAFICTNPEMTNIDFYFFSFSCNKIVFGLILTVFFWMMINATNCSDGIDGFCGSLSINTMLFLFVPVVSGGMDAEFKKIMLTLIICIAAYLWYNSEPSSMMMGDAGSRAIGLFLGIAILKTGNIVLAIPLCFMILLDGLLGIAKVSLKRFLKISILKNIRTPLHDHFRKNKGWSNSQTIFRFQIIQAMISAGFIYLIK